MNKFSRCCGAKPEWDTEESTEEGKEMSWKG